MACAQCSAVIPDGFKYCANCSAALARQSVTGIGDDTHRLLAEANLLRIRKQLDEAIAICTRVLRLDPANATAHSLMGDIHRDEGDYREALGWFKLAVQLNPDNPADRKKLEEMIDHVFPGGKQVVTPTDMESGNGETPSSADAPPPFLWRPALREFLYKITPTQVIITSTVLAVLVMIAILLMFNDRPSMAKKPTGTTPMITTVQPQVTNVTPPTDPGKTLVISPETPTPTPLLNNTTPTPVPPSPTDKADPNVVHVIPPFQPQAKQHMTAEQLEQATTQIRTAMENHLKNLKLQTALREVSLNPATNVLTIKYEVPLMKGPAETKEGLLYSGFELIWVVDNHPVINITRYSLSGYGHLAQGQPAKLALYADVSPQQATDARNAADYATVAKAMSNVWWHDDIANADL